MEHAVGLDIGHSAVKCSIGSTFLFPTAVSPASAQAMEGLTAAAKSDIARVGDKMYFVGETAEVMSNGRVRDGLSDDWTTTDEHAALLVAGYQKALSALSTWTAHLVLGLPSGMYGEQKENLREMAAKHLALAKNKILIVPQPLAAFYTRLINVDGQPNEKLTDGKKWIVVDIGYYTTDFGMFDKGIWSADAQESVKGTSVAAGALKRLIASKHHVKLSVRECEEVLRTKVFSNNGAKVNVSGLIDEAVEALAQDIIDSATRLFGPESLRRATGVFIAGGGASLMFDALQKVWPHAVCAENPRFAVAEGLRRFGLAVVQRSAT